MVGGISSILHTAINQLCGTGAGKSTCCDLLRREFGTAVMLVPEAATLLFSGGFPRHATTESTMATQRAIFHTQRALECVIASMYPGRVLLCDRGSLDGAAYWPGGEDDFLATFGSTLEAELSRYDGVLFFESAACVKQPINSSMLEGGNAHRLEEADEARALNNRLRGIWSQHPNFVEVRSTVSFLEKIEDGAKKATAMLDGIRNNQATVDGDEDEETVAKK